MPRPCPRTLRVLVACEFSGVVRDAFRRLGHDAWSCDLLPAADESPYHYQRDIFDTHGCWYGAVPLLAWDILIAHPPCTFLANSGNKHLYLGKRKENGRDPQRWADMEAGAAFFRNLWELPIDHICIENPIMHGHGKALIGAEPTQIIQPWQFGHGEVKSTCLWLKGLPKLTPTDIVPGRVARVHREPPHPDRWKRRSITYAGIAAAMADQWSRAVLAEQAAEVCQ